MVVLLDYPEADRQGAGRRVEFENGGRMAEAAGDEQDTSEEGAHAGFPVVKPRSICI